MNASVNAPDSVGTDLIIVGGGLWGGLLAYRLAKFHPEVRFQILEQSESLGGNHTWSFHEKDLNQEDSQWILPLVTRSWQSHEVRFPRYTRTLQNAYHSITSERFREVLMPVLGKSLRLNTAVSQLTSHQVTLQDGTHLKAQVVLDARGEKCNDPRGEKSNGARSGSEQLCYQKFVGLDIRTRAPHGLTQPVLMDATCEQLEGYRFFYLLPWTDDTLLIEDTRYSDHAELDVAAMTREVDNYARKQGWEIAKVLRTEVGVLPIPLQKREKPEKRESSTKKTSEHPSAALGFGTRAGICHETSGYSLPMAAQFSRRVAQALSGCKKGPTAAEMEAVTAAVLQDLIRRHSKSAGFYHLLNRMIFRAAEPDRRYRILEYFYRLPEATIQRFYSRRFDWLDKIKIFSGAPPPVPIARAMECFFK